MASMWVLLVGINEYAVARPLRGCVNDVQAMKLFLTTQMGVPEGQIRTLINQEASRAAILGAFQEFLIENPAINPGDPILFHYSGHGSQMPDPFGVEADGKLETLVAYDSRSPGVFDIPDKTLAALLDRLAAVKGAGDGGAGDGGAGSGANITVILDSCHSGSATREANPERSVRLNPVDERTPPLDLDAEILAGAAERAPGASGWATGGVPYVLLAGCRDREEASEHFAQDEGQGAWHGALTYFTLELLKTAPPGLTYADLHEQVAARVKALYPNQSPLCEGSRDRLLFAGQEIQRDPFIRVSEVIGDRVTLEGGLVHGLRQGVELELHPPEVRSRQEISAPPLAVVRVISAGATRASARRTETSPGGPIPVRARGLITRQVTAANKLKVGLENAPDELAGRIQDSPHVTLAQPGETPDLILAMAGGQAHMRGLDGKDLAVVSDPGPQPARRLLEALESLARFRRIAVLRNDSPASRLQNEVSVRLRRAPGGSGSTPAQTEPVEPGPGGEIRLSYDPHNPDRNLYVVEVTNNSPRPVYANIFILNPDTSIYRLYPSAYSEDEIAARGGRLLCGIGYGSGDLLEIYLPGDQPGEPWVSASQDRIKVIVTETPQDLDILQQPALEMPATRRSALPATALGELLHGMLSGATRSARPRQSDPGEDWGALDLLFTTLRQEQTTSIEQAAGRFELGQGLALVKPPGFSGKITVRTATSGRGVQDGETAHGEPLPPPPPPGLEGFPALFEPLGRSGGRGAGVSELLIEIEPDGPTALAAVTPQAPLTLELPVEDGGGDAGGELLAVIFDGQDYLLAGYGAGGGGAEGGGAETGRAGVPGAANRLHLVHLPEPVDDTPSGQPTRRGLGRTLRLFIYKKLGRPTPQIGLRQAALVDGQVQYTAPDPAIIAPGRRVALFVHGFTSDTGWMISQAAQALGRAGLAYDALLTWDYESFGTRVKDNGAQLALALSDLGFSPDDQVTLDVYAHSMGCLVARCMVELAGGERYIDRLVMAGPPNAGTAAANTGRGVIYMLTTLINQLSVIPPVGLANAVLKELFEQGKGVEDIAVDSALLVELNSQRSEIKTPYLVLAGDNSNDASGRAARLTHKLLGQGLDAFFGGDNDIAISVASMQAVRGGHYPALSVARLGCDHFHYFAGEEGVSRVVGWSGSPAVE